MALLPWRVKVHDVPVRVRDLEATPRAPGEVDRPVANRHAFSSERHGNGVDVVNLKVELDSPAAKVDLVARRSPMQVELRTGDVKSKVFFQLERVGIRDRNAEQITVEVSRTRDIADEQVDQSKRFQHESDPSRLSRWWLAANRRPLGNAADHGHRGDSRPSNSRGTWGQG